VIPDVRYYQGTAQSNSSGIAFGDCVPTELERQGVLRWRLIPQESGEAPQPLNQLQAHLAHLATCGWGRNSQALLPDLLRYFGTRQDCTVFHSSAARLTLAGVIANLGFSAPNVSDLDCMSCAKILIVPHHSRRGPNVLWEIERGPAHPLEIAFADRGAYVLRDSSGAPAISTEIGLNRWEEAAFVELFPTADAARAWKTYLDSTVDANDPVLEQHPVVIHGRALLDLLSYADMAEIIEDAESSETHFLTEQGLRLRAEEDPEDMLKLATPDELLARLPWIRSAI
jgi:hypothetical protein